MITRFFSTSKPIHLVIVSFIALVITIGANYHKLSNSEAISNWAVVILSCAVVLASISLLAFFVSKNSLTAKNSYKILFFVILMAIIPKSLENFRILFANLFLLLAMRRVYSLRSNLRVKKKLLDAGFWTALATLCYFGAVLFYAWIFVAIVLYAIDEVKNWAIPVIAALAVAIIYISYFILIHGTYGNFVSDLQAPSLDFTPYNDLEFVIAITIIVSLGIWAAVSYAIQLKDKPKNFRSSHLLVMYSAIISLIIVVISPEKNGSEFLFLLAPLAIIMTNFLEKLKDKWFAEVYVWLLVITPIALLVLDL